MGTARGLVCRFTMLERQQACPRSERPYTVSQVFDELSRLITLDFWLGAPLRIVLIVVFAAIIRVLLSLVIKKITHSVARGTTARVVRDEQNTAHTWRTDTIISNSRQAQRARTVGSVLSSVASIVVWTMAVLMIISELGFNIAPVIASAGIAGVALSFGAQSLVKDFLAGIFIVAEDQLGIGDFVDLGEASGTVESVGLRITDVRDANGTLWHVRNGEIIRVGNSSQGWARTNIDLPIPYDSDIDQVTEVLLDAARRAIADPTIAPHVLDEPQVLGVEAVSGESLTVRVSVKTAPSQQWAVARALRVALKQALDAHGARIPLLNQSVIRREN